MNSKFNEEVDYTKGVSSRGKGLEFTTIIDVIQIVKEKAPYYFEMIKDGKLPKYQQIYRGAGHISKDSSRYNAVKLYDPLAHIRHSANTENYYTEIIDHSKYWEDYPNRTSSIVASTNITRAKEYGTVYHVIPLNENVKFGVCSEYDIWNSFDFALEKLDSIFAEDMAIPTATPDFKHLAGLNNFIKTKFDLPKNASYVDMKRKLVFNDNTFKLLDRPSTWNNSKFDYDREEILKLQNKWGSFLNYLEYLLSPKWNNFELISYNSKVILPSNREVWTDSECLLIEHSVHEKMLIALE